VAAEQRVQASRARHGEFIAQRDFPDSPRLLIVAGDCRAAWRGCPAPGSRSGRVRPWTPAGNRLGITAWRLFGGWLAGTWVFRNENNSADLVISRRRTAVQAPHGIVTTIQFRDPAVRMPCQLAGAFPVRTRDITVTGRVADADLGNLFPRMFRLVTAGYAWTVHLWWWKFASPVRDGDIITVRGSHRELPGDPVIRVSSFTSHWLQIHHP
jgi:hypothetical protein